MSASLGTYGLSALTHPGRGLLPSWTPHARHAPAGIFPRAGGVESEVEWNVCGDGLQCANISVPLDHHNASDERTLNIAVTRFPATDQDNRKGSIFINPGGPGGSGTGMASLMGSSFSDVVKGQYDILGFDPRGIGQTSGRVTCFASRLQDSVFKRGGSFQLDLPANASILNSTETKYDLQQQIARFDADMRSLAKQCEARTGEGIGYYGTEAVVQDINWIAKKIDGEDTPLNYWGFSYGTLIGQYLVKILPPSRIGRVIIDGVVNPDLWNDYYTSSFEQGLEDIDKLLESFASSCVKAGANCSLNAARQFDTPAALLDKLDNTIDALYSQPVPVYGLAEPAVANAGALRRLIFNAMYTTSLWDPLASLLLGPAFNGNFTPLANTTFVSGADEALPDPGTFAAWAVYCADAKPYSAQHPPPTVAELAELTLGALDKNSRRVGDAFWAYSLCPAWDAAGLLPRKTYYNGMFELPDNTLTTPILVLSSTLDNVTPLRYAKLANERLGNNARLVQQVDGWGHTALSQVSYCTGQIVQAYFLNGTLPTKNQTLCELDQTPWQPVNAVEPDGTPDGDLRSAWTNLSLAWQVFL